jgi:hypothetical protein
VPPLRLVVAGTDKHLDHIMFVSLVVHVHQQPVHVGLESGE